MILVIMVPIMVVVMVMLGRLERIVVRRLTIS
jgi:hypothetical protein